MNVELFDNPLIAIFTSPGPIIFELGPLTIRWYGLLIASAVLIGVYLAQYLGKHRSLDPEIVGDLAIWLVIGAIPFARLYYVIFEWPQYRQHPETIIAIWQGGIAIHGAIIGGVIAALIFCKIQKTSFWQMADIFAPSLALGQTIGRWGNFFNSEAFGSPTDLPWKLYIPSERRPIGYENIEYYHPTFLYESLWNSAVLIILLTLFFQGWQGKKLRTGSIFLVYLIAYSCGRIWIEGLRTDSLMFGPIRVAQLVSLTGIFLGIVGLLWLYSWRKPLPDVVQSENFSKS